MSEAQTLSPGDALEDRDADNRLGTISELAYARSAALAVAHAGKTRAVAPLQPWVNVGPRNVGGRIVSLVQDPGNALILYAGSAHGGLWRTADGGDSWSHLGPPSFNVPVGALALHPRRPNVLYVGTGSVTAGYVAGDGLFRVTIRPDGTSDPLERLARAPLPGETPAAAADGAAARYTRIEVDPDEPDRFWAASQTGLWRCKMVGAVAHWTRDFPPAADKPAGTPDLANAPVFDGSDDFPPYATDLRIARDPRSDETVLDGTRKPRYLIIHLAVESAGVFRGRYDRLGGSVTWDHQRSVQPGAPFPAAFGRVLIAMCRRQPQHLYVVFDVNRLATGICASADNGERWSAKGALPAADNNQAEYSMVLEVHPDDPRIVVGGTLNVALSSDGGEHFAPILEWWNYDLGDHAQHADQHVALFDAFDRRKLWIGNDGGLSMARDVTRRDPGAFGYWRKRSHGIVAGQFQDVAVHPVPALAYLSAGGLQDNGSWVSFGGPTWYRCGWADGSGIAIDASNPRQFIVSQNGGMNLANVAGGFAVGTDFVIESPVLHDLPVADPRMRVRLDWYATPAVQASLQGKPFVGLVEQDPRLGNAGSGLYSWVADQAPIGTASSPVAVVLPTPPALLPALPRVGAAAVLAGVPLPAAPLLDVGEECSAIAMGPVPAVAPFRVDGWIGTSRGNLFWTGDAPVPVGPAAWVSLGVLPSIDGLVYAPTRFAIHPGNTTMVAVSAIAAERACVISIVGPGAAPAATFQVQFSQARNTWSPAVGPTPTSAGFVRLAQTTLFLSFPAAHYNIGDSWFVTLDGQVRVASINPVNGGLVIGPAALNGKLLAAAPLGRVITVTIAAGGVQFTHQFAGLPVQPALPVGPVVELPLCGVVLHFSGGPFVAGHSWTIAPDNTVAAVGAVAGAVEVLARLQGRVFLTYNGGLLWQDISFPQTRPAPLLGADTGALPFGPVTSARFDVGGGNIDLYVGTLAGVFVADNLPAAAPLLPALVDAHWRPFNGTAGHELPQTLVNDIETIAGTRCLRVATFGRGIWDCDLAGAMPRFRLLIRQTIIDDGRTNPRLFPPAVPDDPRLPAGQAWLDHAHAFDIRVDSAPFEFFDDRVDGVEFDERLGVDALVPLAPQAIYVQVHNWGWDEVREVFVHLLFAPAGVPAPVPMGGAAPAVSMPAGLPDTSFYVTPNFDPVAPSPWRRVAPPVKLAVVRPYEPVVVRFDWRPPASLAVPAPNDHVALLALCGAADDPLPPALAPGATLATFIAGELRAALRVVPIRAKAPAALHLRDGVDDDARAGGVAFVGRSPDLIVVDAEPADPAAAFADLLSTRPLDQVRIAADNHVYVRVHNRGAEASDTEVHVWSLPLDALDAPAFAPAGWTRLTPAAAPFLVVNVPAGGTALAHVLLANPADPAPGFEHKAIAVVALIRSADNTDPLPDTAAITDIDTFWTFFGSWFDADNAALRVLKAVP